MLLLVLCVAGGGRGQAGQDSRMHALWTAEKVACAETAWVVSSFHFTLGLPVRWRLTHLPAPVHPFPDLPVHKSHRRSKPRQLRCSPSSRCSSREDAGAPFGDGEECEDGKEEQRDVDVRVHGAGATHRLDPRLELRLRFVPGGLRARNHKA